MPQPSLLQEMHSFKDDSDNSDLDTHKHIKVAHIFIIISLG